ncbi:MAG: hypothetical protein NTU85_00040 [Candidatus Kaiserbacteria bacterium]|nr:hypothetical protein [Candidatus Kaiserbacteria bacterium]
MQVIQRNHIIVYGAGIIAIAIGILAFLYSGRSSSNTLSSAAVESNPVTAISIPFAELARGTQSAVTTRTNYLITSTDELNKLWQMIDAKGKPPAINFATSSVVAVFAGDYSAIDVSTITDTNIRTVTVLLREPRNSTTTPYELITLPKTTLAFTHKDEQFPPN